MRITESTLRRVIRSVIKESINVPAEAGHRNLEIAVNDVRGDDPYVYDRYIKDHIEKYIDVNYIDELNLANADGPLDTPLDQVPSQRLEQDYDKVISEMDDYEYEKMTESVFKSILDSLEVKY